MKLKERKKVGSVFELLTSREKEIVNLIFDGKRVIEIAELLHVKLNTISTIKKVIYLKTSVNNNIDLFKLALKEGYLQDSLNDPPLYYKWSYIGNPNLANYALSEKKGSLALRGNSANLSNGDLVTFIGKRQEHEQFTATTLFDFNPSNNLEEAGITVFIGINNHIDFSIKNYDGERMLWLMYNAGNINHIKEKIPLFDGVVELKVEGVFSVDKSKTKNVYIFSYRQGNGVFKQIASINPISLNSEAPIGFTNVFIGLYATGNGHTSKAIANFYNFEYMGK